MPRTSRTRPVPRPEHSAPPVITGSVDRIEAHPDGSWTITPRTGTPLRVTFRPAAEADRPQSARHDVIEGETCGCVPTAPVTITAARAAALQQARAVAAALGDLGVPAPHRSAAYEEHARRAVVRVATTHGLYALHVPPMGAPFTVDRDGYRNGALGARRVPAVSDDHVAALYVAYLRDRGELN
ncbi:MULTISPECIES: hypothetical protein [unclassified Streptomyces]|uniref:hypothetical protein n=1 Tax=unclassified Streptomyces TaxID=2593676 RepID=UPI0033DCE1C3